MPRVLNKRTDKISSNAVYVDRPSKWGNPFKIGRDGTREGVINLYANTVRSRLLYDPHCLDELIGKDLVCWCAPLPCHGDVLLKLANGL